AELPTCRTGIANLNTWHLDEKANAQAQPDSRCPCLASQSSKHPGHIGRWISDGTLKAFSSVTAPDGGIRCSAMQRGQYQQLIGTSGRSSIPWRSSLIPAHGRPATTASATCGHTNMNPLPCFWQTTRPIAGPSLFSRLLLPLPVDIEFL